MLAPLVLEVLEVRLPPLGAILEHPVEVLQHLPEPLEVLRSHALERLLHALHEGLQHLLAERLHQLLEEPPGFRIHELVLRELLDLPAGVVRELVEGLAPLGGHLLQLAEAFLGNLPALGALARLGEPPLDALALRLADRLELLLDVVEGRAEIVAVQLALAPLAHALHEVPQAGQLALRSLQAPLEEPAERALEIALGHQLLGHGVQEILGVEVPDLLRPVPARVADPHVHGPTVREAIPGVNEGTPGAEMVWR